MKNKLQVATRADRKEGEPVPTFFWIGREIWAKDRVTAAAAAAAAVC